MTYKVYAYVRNNGDGSNSIEWFEHELTEEMLTKDYDWEAYVDGDGLHYSCHLKFNSKDEAISAGLTVSVWQNEDGTS